MEHYAGFQLDRDSSMPFSGTRLCSGVQASRDETLHPLIERLCGCSDHGDNITAVRPAAATWTIDRIVSDAPLRSLLLADASLAALLPAFSGSIVVDGGAAPPFCIEASGTVVRLAPLPIASEGALIVAARWALEVAELSRSEDTAPASRCASVVAALEHGAALARGLAEAERQVLGAWLSPALRRYLLAEPQARAAALPAAVRGLLGLVAAPRAGDAAAEFDDPSIGLARTAVAGLCELTLPLEQILVAGGDTRLRVDPVRGLNRYGTAPRPRPEAVQFSSSTASSISDYGLRLCDTLRRRLLRRGVADGASTVALYTGLADLVRREIGAILGLEPDQADIVLAASGTDTELLAVLLALAADPRPLTNVLIAPEETGRGVVLAGEGRFFDEAAATGLAVRKGEPAWPGRRIEIRSVAIRDGAGRVRPAEALAAEVRRRVGDALAAGHRALVHVVLGSKTGISAPPLEFVEELRRLDEERVDVVVDACQLRATPSLLGSLARRGWMVQVSGSKFLTGPAFSGALVVPTAMRQRRAAAAALLAAAAAVSRPDDWPPAWRSAFGKGDLPSASFGMLFRWAAALGEAHLLRAVPRALCRAAFDRFHAALQGRLEVSDVLVPLPPPDGHLADLGEEPPGLAARSIICFAPAVTGAHGERRLATLEECQLLFEFLNRDVSTLLPDLTPMERLVAERPAHIGQPVALRPDRGEAPTVLRLVVGARFFTIVGFAPNGDTEAALAGEIADAITALDKLELLARRLADLR